MIIWGSFTNKLLVDFIYGILVFSLKIDIFLFFKSDLVPITSLHSIQFVVITAVIIAVVVIVIITIIITIAITMVIATTILAITAIAVSLLFILVIHLTVLIGSS